MWLGDNTGSLFIGAGCDTEQGRFVVAAYRVK